MSAMTAADPSEKGSSMYSTHPRTNHSRSTHVRTMIRQSLAAWLGCVLMLGAGCANVEPGELEFLEEGIVDEGALDQLDLLDEVLPELDAVADDLEPIDELPPAELEEGGFVVDEPPGDVVDIEHALERGESGEELLAGYRTYKYWSVGRFFRNNRMCTASLVTRRVAITAAHCVDYGSNSRHATYGWFRVNQSGSRYYNYRVVRVRSFGRGVGADDIALVQLGSRVPSWVVKHPRGLARYNPKSGEGVSRFGYGCTNRSTKSGTHIKRRFNFTWRGPNTRTRTLCPGDSGGPTLRRNGNIFQINSGHYLSGGGTDILGSVPRNWGRLMAQVRAWR